MIFDDKGILGLNARNLLYIRPYNKKKQIRLADDKIKSKHFLSARGIPVPKLYGVIKDKQEAEKFDFNSLPSSFVLKPNFGFGGEGIIVIVNKKGDHWIKANGNKISKEDLQDHISDILDGRFSISNVGDTAFFEQLVISHDALGNYAYRGLPDIRVVVYNLIPVMAMLRLPTRESDGKANLQQGAVGVGIDIAKGETTYISYKNSIIDEIPDIGPIRGLKIPFWDDILYIASNCQLITNLGYLAADISLDKNSGPVLLEINARAGLKVQIANLAPLKKRLQQVKGIKVTTPVKGVRVAKDMFGNIAEKNIHQITGKSVIGLEEIIELILKDGSLRVTALMSSANERTIIDKDFAIENGLLEDEYEYNDEKSTIKVKLAIAGERKQTVVDIEKMTNKDYKVIVGSRDLSNFFIDTSKKIQEKKSIISETAKLAEKQINKKVSEPTFVKSSMELTEVDQRLIEVDEKIKLLYHLRPLNLKEEEEKFFNNFKENPQFVYPDLKFNPFELRRDLNKILIPENKIGNLFDKKRKEILKKVALLEYRGYSDEFTAESVDLFGKPDEEMVDECKGILEKSDVVPDVKGGISAEEAKDKFEDVFDKYGLTKWEVKIKSDMVADVVAGKNNRLFVRDDATFTEDRIENLIIHEIETHILTAENGKNQKYELFNRGFANYLETQEGLAIYNILTQKEEEEKRLYLSVSLVYAVNMALKSSFVQIFEKMLDYRIPPQRAFRTALKVKRGIEDTSLPGAFTKDFIYYKGYKSIKEYIAKGGKIKNLYQGKFSVEDVDSILELPGLKDPKYIPSWLIE